MSENSNSAMPDRTVEEAAALLAEAQATMTPIGRLPSALNPTSVEDAYRIQRAGHRLAGQVLGPWKVGATTTAAQRILGVDGPFIGRPARDRVVPGGTELSLNAWFLGAPAIEAEIGLILRQDLDTLPDDPMDLASMIDVVPCLELVNSRFVDMTTVGASSLIADNAVASAIVQGDQLDLDESQVRALDAVRVDLHIDGIETASGTGALALGHPLNVLHHAAGLAISWNTPIQTGELVITGTCTGLVPAAAGATATGYFDGATVEASFR